MAENESIGNPVWAGHQKPNERIYGVVDLLRANRIAGWAVDRSDSAAAVSVEIWREGSRMAVVRADRLRPDLVKGGVGSGHYGFVADIDPPIEPGFEFTVIAKARGADGAAVVLGRNTSAGEKAGAERRLAERLFEEVLNVRADVAALTGRDSCAEEIGRLRVVLDQIEVVQARIDASAASLGVAPVSETRAGLRIVAGVAIAIALGALGVAGWSWLFDAGVSGLG